MCLVEQHHPPPQEVLHDAATDGQTGIGSDAAQAHDPSGPAMHDLKRVERHPAVQIDVPEVRQFVQADEVAQPGQAFTPVEAFQLVESLFLGTRPLVRRPQVVDGQLGEADLEGGGAGSDRLA